MDKIYTIYGYLNIITLMWYVGRTCQRLQCQRAGKNGSKYVEGRSRCPKFADAIQEFGWPSFEYHILATTTDLEESYRLEQYWIEQKNSVEKGYNTSTGGNGCYGVVESKERRDKISQSHLGKAFSDEHKSRLSESHNGLKYSSERNKRISDTLLGKNINNPSYSRRVQQFTKDGQFVAEYPSISEASRHTEAKAPNISACCKGKQKTAGGSIWVYAN